MTLAAVESPVAPRGSVLTRGARKLRVMQMTDWLAPGGKERVALNLSNMLPRDRFESVLCTTRAGGALESLVEPHVQRLKLERSHRFSVRAIRNLVAFNAAEGIDIMHAHGSSLFFAVAAAMFPPFPAVVWHDHYGPCRHDDRSTRLYRAAARRVSGVIAVNRPLAAWATHTLRVPRERVWYIPNFVSQAARHDAPADLPGVDGRRIVCVANLRPQKDHVTLFNAMVRVRATMDDAHLILLGEGPEAYTRELQAAVAARHLTNNVSFFGYRDNVEAILRRCDVGVLSSLSEGFPLALVEYGEAALASVSTRVGESEEVLDDGRAGVLVQPSDPDALAAALVRMLTDVTRRRTLGAALKTRVTTLYRPAGIIERVCQVYDTVARGSGAPVPAM